MLSPFANEPVLELRRSVVRAQLSDALARVDRELPISVPVRIGSDERVGDQLESTDPGAPDRLVARAARADASDAAAAISRARQGLRAWRSMPAAERAEALIGAAAWLR